MTAGKVISDRPLYACNNLECLVSTYVTAVGTEDPDCPGCGEAGIKMRDPLPERVRRPADAVVEG